MKAACVDNAAFIVQFGREQKCVVASDLKKWEAETSWKAQSEMEEYY
jgi:hypothetical protein